MAKVFFELPAAELMRALRAARAGEILDWEQKCSEKRPDASPLFFSVYVEPTPKGGFNFVGTRPNLLFVTNTLRGRSHVGAPFVFTPPAELLSVVPNDDVQASELVIVGTDEGVEVKTAGDNVLQHRIPGGWYKEAPQGAGGLWRRTLATALNGALPGLHPQVQLSALCINGLGVAETHHMVVRFWQRDFHSAPIVIRPTDAHVDFIAIVTTFVTKANKDKDGNWKSAVTPLVPQWLNPAAMADLDVDEWAKACRDIAAAQGVTGRAAAVMIAARLRHVIPDIDDMRVTHTASMICDKISHGDES